MNAVIRDIRPIAVEVNVKVRNIQAESFDDAKERAQGWLPKCEETETLSAFAARECDGSYTVEFR